MTKVASRNTIKQVLAMKETIDVEEAIAFLKEKANTENTSFDTIKLLSGCGKSYTLNDCFTEKKNRLNSALLCSKPFNS